MIACIMDYCALQERQRPLERSRVPVYHPTPNVSRPANQLTEDEQIKIAKRMGLISHLPLGVYDGSSKKGKEYVSHHIMHEYTCNKLMLK